MPRSVQGCSAAWLCSLAFAMIFRHPVALANISTKPLIGLTSAGLQEEVRQLQQNVTPDCGLAFQPCCSGEQACLDEEFTCIAREPVARCEPCGTPFSQPCPQSPYCEASELIPTTRRSNAVIQCRPCGQEWQPCCAVLDSLCGDGFMCYAEQDRCVVPVYADVKEEFFPDLVSEAMNMSPICGGLNDPPCMEPSTAGPTWQCDPKLVTFVPVFLCMEDTMSDRQVPADCGAEDQAPCVDGCGNGLTSVIVSETNEALCLKTFSLTSEPQPTTEAVTPAPVTPVEPTMQPEPVDPALSRAPVEPIPSPEPVEPTPSPPVEPTDPVAPVSEGDCGGFDQPICQEGEECICGLMAGEDGSCVEDPAGCLLPEIRDSDQVQDQSGPFEPAPTQKPCGILDAKPCSKLLVQPCECSLYLDPETGLCRSEVSGGALCPQRPYCGYDNGPPCAFPYESPCDECNEVDPSSAICVRNPTCTRVDTVEDQSLQCGKRDQPSCPNEPFCKGRLVPTEEGKCKRCGVGAGSRPCDTFPYCKGRFISASAGVQLEACKQCGAEGKPPCLHEDTGRQIAGASPCDKGLQRTSVTAGNVVMLLPGQDSYCTSATLPGQCGFVGQNSCSGECKGRSTATEDGLQCVECGGPGQGTCDGANQDLCDAGLVSFQEASLAPICVCPLGGCNTAVDDCSGDGVIDQSGGGGTSVDDSVDEDDEDVSADCGDLGQPRCTFDDGPACSVRLLADEDGTCVPCGDAPGDVPCEEDDPPRCGFRLVLDNDFCESCGGPDEPVCCDKGKCSDDPENKACDEGLYRTGANIGTAVIRTVTAEAYCSTVDSGNRCGLIGQPPCLAKVEDSGLSGTVERPCIGLAVPSLDGTLCVPCGNAGDLPCYDREKECTGRLITVFDSDFQPAFCFEIDNDDNSDLVADQSGGDCGLPGMVGCMGTATPCTGRSNTQAIISDDGTTFMCIPCGGVDQLACTAAEPCDGSLRLYTKRCVACGGLSEPVCPRPEMGPPCNTDLQAFGTTCEPAGNAPEKVEVVDQSFSECGSEGVEPCPGQPACGDLLFLVEEAGSLKCSSTQPAVDYPSGEDCGGTGQPVCDEAPHCSESLFATYPEGLCLPSMATAVNCGTLGNAPCETGRRCETGLAVRSGVCAPTLAQPCGIRGFSVCLGRSQLCNNLLSPSFPSMVCVDSSRSDAQPCGVLGMSACLDLDCASGLVVHPSTKVCVPPADEPCGGARQTQCFWNGDVPCQEGLEPKGGICKTTVS